MSLAEQEDRNALETLAGYCLLRYKGYSEEAIAKKLRFDSVSDMHKQLRDWDIPEWLMGGGIRSGSEGFAGAEC